MCGIAGIFSYGDMAPPIDAVELGSIRDHMLKRGPDSAGTWISADRRIGFAHRRLSIIDLSDAGSQPMTAANGRLWLTFNGEIYNYRELRRMLQGKGYAFRSDSDSEVVLNLYAERGVEMLHDLRGMYAFAIWDNDDQSLLIARDPFGIKPLYYADNGNTLRFASQVKALVAGRAIDLSHDPAGLAGFLMWGAIPEPFTSLKAVCALPAGQAMRLNLGGRRVIWTHFSVRDELICAEHSQPNLDMCAEAVSGGLHDSVMNHVYADVPLGAFLSSGMDSAAIVGHAAAGTHLRLHTLTLAFTEYRGTGNDETELAHAIAEACGTHHEDHWVTPDEFSEEIANVLSAMDQPTTDGVNTYFVSRAAAESSMKVALSGLGGDELLSGYPSFRHVPRLARWLSFARHMGNAGTMARKATASALGCVTSPKYSSLLEYGGTYEGAYLIRRALHMPWELSAILDPAIAQAGLERLDTLSSLRTSIDGITSSRGRVVALEMQWYMRNQLLKDADWAGMAHSLEIRVPFVDVKLFKTLAPYVVSKRPPTKLDALAAISAPIPKERLARRRKSGFLIPIQEWASPQASRGSNLPARGLRPWSLRVLNEFAPGAASR